MTWEGVIIVVEELEEMDVRSRRLSITSVQFMDRECNYPRDDTMFDVFGGKYARIYCGWLKLSSCIPDILLSPDTQIPHKRKQVSPRKKKKWISDALQGVSCRHGESRCVLQVRKKTIRVDPDGGDERYGVAFWFGFEEVASVSVQYAISWNKTYPKYVARRCAECSVAVAVWPGSVARPVDHRPFSFRPHRRAIPYSLSVRPVSSMSLPPEKAQDCVTLGLAYSSSFDFGPQP